MQQGGKWMTNTHQGHFPEPRHGADGHEGIAPVGQFAPNGYVLYDITGNVWQWTKDLYRADYYAALSATNTVARNPQGPNTSLDPAEPGVQKRVQRGGSFLCTAQYCSRYILGTRGKGEVSRATNHIGFRFVEDGPRVHLAQLRKCPNNRHALLLQKLKNGKHCSKSRPKSTIYNPTSHGMMYSMAAFTIPRALSHF